MATAQTMKTCIGCGKPTVHLEQRMNHILHLILTVITAGIWALVWILLAVLHDTNPQCTQCGQSRGIIQDSIRLLNQDNHSEPMSPAQYQQHRQHLAKARSEAQQAVDKRAQEHQAHLRNIFS